MTRVSGREAIRVSEKILLTLYSVVAFESFLDTYKTTKTKSAVDALLDMNIDDDDLSDDYDFVDSDDEAAHARRNAAKQAPVPRKKYMEILQRVANRLEDEITIDLDDVAEVMTISFDVEFC